MLRGVDSSLADEWERMRDPEYLAEPVAAGARAVDLRPPRAEDAADITKDTRAFTAAVRTRIFTFLRDWDLGHLPAADPGGTGVPAVAAFRADHGALRLDPEARNLRHTYVTPSENGDAWRVQQMLVDTEGHNDWVAEFEVDLAASREAQEAVVRVTKVGPL